MLNNYPKHYEEALKYGREDGFFHAKLPNDADHLPHLVHADYLEESNKPASAEFMRNAVQNHPDKIVSHEYGEEGNLHSQHTEHPLYAKVEGNMNSGQYSTVMKHFGTTPLGWHGEVSYEHPMENQEHAQSTADAINKENFKLPNFNPFK